MFNTNIPLYGYCILLSILVGIIIVYKILKKLRYNKNETNAFIIYLLIGSMFGAKYFTYFANLEKYNWEFNFFKVGLSSYGAVIGILILMFVFSKQFKRKLGEVTYILCIPLPIMYSIGKVGCFLAGCCYGIKYSGSFSIIYKYSISAPNNISLFPIQILESIIFFIIFVVIVYLSKRKTNRRNIISYTFISCGFFKFILEYLRESHVGKIISLNQIASIVFIIIGIYILLENKIKKCN